MSLHRLNTQLGVVAILLDTITEQVEQELAAGEHLLILSTPARHVAIALERLDEVLGASEQIGESAVTS